MAGKNSRARSNEVERRIHFYRADCGADGAGTPKTFQPAAALNHINGLSFDSFENSGGRYFEDGDNVYCCWVESQTRIQFAVIRRTALPTIEEQGIQRALNISATAGLVETIHVRFFPQNIVGFDFNFYGPRLPRLAKYLNEVANGKAAEVAFQPLVRQDVAAELSQSKELRMFQLRIRRPHVQTVKQADRSLGSAFEELLKVSTGQELEIIIRPKPYSGDSVGTKLMTVARNLARRKDIREIARDFRVKVASPGGAVEHLDLLGDHFIADTRILKESSKGRALDSADAYRQIEGAFKEREKELKQAATIFEI